MPDPEQTGPADVPTDLERDYLVMMYQEHAEHARLHETLRAAVTSLLIALIAGLLASPGAQAYPRRIGFIICAISALGAMLNAKHYEKFELHTNIMAGFRSRLEHYARQEISSINSSRRKLFDRQNARLKFIRLRHLWLGVYGVTFLTGLLFIAHL